MYYIRIQRTAGCDTEYTFNTLGMCIKYALAYVLSNTDYRGHFILKVKDK